MLYVENDQLMDDDLSLQEAEDLGVALQPSGWALLMHTLQLINVADGGGSAHGDANWSVKTSCLVLLTMIGLFALVSEVWFDLAHGLVRTVYV